MSGDEHDEDLDAFDQLPRRIDASGAEWVTARFVLGGARNMGWTEHLAVAPDQRGKRKVIPTARRLLDRDYWEIGDAPSTPARDEPDGGR